MFTRCSCRTQCVCWSTTSSHWWRPSCQCWLTSYINLSSSSKRAALWGKCVKAADWSHGESSVGGREGRRVGGRGRGRIGGVEVGGSGGSGRGREGKREVVGETEGVIGEREGGEEGWSVGREGGSGGEREGGSGRERGGTEWGRERKWGGKWLKITTLTLPSMHQYTADTS